MISVLRSHLEDVGDMDRECHSAVFSSNGVFGSRNFAMPVGDESILRAQKQHSRGYQIYRMQQSIVLLTKEGRSSS